MKSSKIDVNIRLNADEPAIQPELQPTGLKKHQPRTVPFVLQAVSHQDSRHETHNVHQHLLTGNPDANQANVLLSLPKVTHAILYSK